VHKLKPEASDPLNQTGERALVGQLCPQRRRAVARYHLTVLELGAQYRARLADEGDLVRARSHRNHVTFVAAQVRRAPDNRLLIGVAAVGHVGVGYRDRETQCSQDLSAG
jgi:hypothetical protein